MLDREKHQCLFDFFCYLSVEASGLSIVYRLNVSTLWWIWSQHLLCIICDAPLCWSLNNYVCLFFFFFYLVGLKLHECCATACVRVHQPGRQYECQWVLAPSQLAQPRSPIQTEVTALGAVPFMSPLRSSPDTEHQHKTAALSSATKHQAACYQ